MSRVLIELRGLAKAYRRYARPRDRLREWVSLGRVVRHQAFHALAPLDLEVRAGECLAIVGENGAGKSTLLKLIAGVIVPSAGTVATRGRVVSLLELGTGFHPELDGIENLRQSARILGFPDTVVRERLPEILAFAELGDFVRQPVKTYSSGMYVRLAFALFAHLDPEIYIVDEALSVGDVFFQQKCFRFLEQLKAKGAAILFASHDMQAVLRLSDRALLLEHGRQVALGEPVEIVHLYYSRHGAGRGGGPASAPVLPEVSAEGRIVVPADAQLSERALAGRRGTRQVEICGARFVDTRGVPCRAAAHGGSVTLQLFARARSDVHDLTFGFQITDRMNTVVFGQTIFQKDRTVLRAHAGEAMLAEFEIDLPLAEGSYVFQVAASDCQLEVANVLYDLIENALTLEVRRETEISSHGLTVLPVRYRVLRGSA